MKNTILLQPFPKVGFKGGTFLKSLIFVLFILQITSTDVFAGGSNFMSKYRWRNDDGSETTATWKAAENTGITLTSANTNFRLRIAHTGVNFGGYLPPAGYSLQYSTDQTNWTSITSDGTTNAFALSSTTHFSDGDPTTNQLSTTDFTAWYCISSSTISPAPPTPTAGNELEWCMKATSNAIAGTYYFRSINANLTFTYDVTATLIFSPNCTNPTDGGEIDGDQSVCYNTVTTELASISDPSGETGTLEYQWQSNTVSSTFTFDDIVGANTNTYQPGTVTQTTWFKRLARVSCKDDWTGAAESNEVEVTVEQLAVAGTLSKTPDVTYICQGDDVSASLTAGSGGNGTDELEFRTKTGSDWSDWFIYASETEISSTGKTGIEVRTRRMASYCSNSDYTTVSWIVDLTNPLAVAKESGSVTLDPTGNYTLTTADVLSSYSDAGVGLETVSMVPASVSCANLGLITVTVTVTDYCGNQTVVAPQITVLEGTALLSPWVRANTSPGANGSADYSPCTNDGTFHMTAMGVSAPKSDVMNFVSQQLCGNGTVIARLDDSQNGGWAGVMMRENNAPGSKAVLFKTKLYNPSVIIGFRATTDAKMVNVSQMIPSIHWMKIQRSGNTFQIFTSYNGVAWNRRYTATVVMPNCIEAGIFTESIQANRTVTSWFDQVEVVGYLKSEEEGNVIADSRDAFEIEFYPNPTLDQITIMAPENDGTIKVTLINANGSVVETDEFNTMDAIYNLQHIKPGVYLLRFERDGMVVNKRLIVM